MTSDADRPQITSREQGPCNSSRMTSTGGSHHHVHPAMQVDGGQPWLTVQLADHPIRLLLLQLAQHDQPVRLPVRLHQPDSDPVGGSAGVVQRIETVIGAASPVPAGHHARCLVGAEGNNQCLAELRLAKFAMLLYMRMQPWDTHHIRTPQWVWLHAASIPGANVSVSAAFQIGCWPAVMPRREHRSRMSTLDSCPKGQEIAKRAVTVAAAGRHHLLMIGSPGHRQDAAGPAAGDDPARSVARGKPGDDAHLQRRRPAAGRAAAAADAAVPVAASHDQRSRAGRRRQHADARRDLASAHHGVLFLDELPEFNRRTLEVLRQPLEERLRHDLAGDGQRDVSGQPDAGGGDEPLPVRLSAATRKRQCNCNPMQIERYLARISGPLLDRIDIHIEVPPVPFRELSERQAGHRPAPRCASRSIAARDDPAAAFRRRARTRSTAR